MIFADFDGDKSFFEMSDNLPYVSNRPINLFKIIEDTKWVYGPYRMRESDVKLEPLKLAFLKNLTQFFRSPLNLILNLTSTWWVLFLSS